MNHIRNEDGREYRVYNATFTEREDNMEHSYTQHEESLEARIDQVVREYAGAGKKISRSEALDLVQQNEPELVKAYHDEARQRARLP